MQVQVLSGVPGGKYDRNIDRAGSGYLRHCGTMLRCNVLCRHLLGVGPKGLTFPAVV